MDVYLYQSLLLSVVAVALLQLAKLALKKPGAAPPPLPPGPWKLPVVGSMHHLVNVLPHRALRDLAAAHGPLMLLQLGQTPLMVASSREAARAVLKTHDANFATRPKLLAGEIVGYEWADILFAPSGDYWRKLRQLCAAEILSPKRVLSFRHIREDEGTEKIAKNGTVIMMMTAQSPNTGCTRSARPGPSAPVNLSAMFHSITNSVVSRAAFGKKRENAAEFLAVTMAVVGLSSGFNIPDLFPTCTTVLARLTGMTRSLKEIHRTVDTILQPPGDHRGAQAARDVKIESGAAAKDVDVLIGLQEKGGFGFQLTNSVIKAIILDMFAGGTGTSGSAMEWGMSELMRNPAAFRGKAAVTEGDLQASNLRYMKVVIKEALRLHPPTPLLVPRETIEACELGGYTIPHRLASARPRMLPYRLNDVTILPSDTNKIRPKHRLSMRLTLVKNRCQYEFRPKRFKDGTRDFTSSNYKFLPFSSGCRMCPGFNYGLASMELALVGLLYHFNLSLPEGVKEVDMEEAPVLDIHRRTPLVLCATPYTPHVAT
uniref:Cytochrome P450 n=1 Tax=Setaria italica TaxID=4555 RepID=K4AIM2_SETIT